MDHSNIFTMKTKRTYVFLLVAAMAFTMWQCGNAGSGSGQDKGQAADQKQEPVKKEKPQLVYDDRGNVIERHGKSYRKTDGSIRSNDSYYYAYDDSNNVIKEIKESYNIDGSRKFKNVNYYQYDHRNLKIDLVFESYDENDELLRTAHHSYKYNERGHKVEDIGYANDGSVISRIIMNPDETGLLLSEEYLYYDEQGVITDHKKYFYTEYGLEKTVDLLKDK